MALVVFGDHMITGITASVYEDTDKSLKKALETGFKPKAALVTNDSYGKTVGFIDEPSVGVRFQLSDDKSLLIVGERAFKPVSYKSKAFKRTSKVMFTEI